jgi:uncharacterized Zn finger protein
MTLRDGVGEDQVRARGSKSGAPGDLLTDAGIAAASAPKVFDRGRTYAASGAVPVTEELQGADARIRGEIDGTQTYETKVWLEDGAIGGSCDCPHPADGWFCKHQVALCLVWRERARLS